MKGDAAKIRKISDLCNGREFSNNPMSDAILRILSGDPEKKKRKPNKSMAKIGR